MPAIVVVAAAGGWLLVGAGLMKIRHPESTQQAIRSLVSSTAAPWQSRLLGVVEVAIGVVFLAAPGPIPAAALGLAYTTTFVSAALLKRREVDCGCFGQNSTKVGPSHVVVSAVSAVAAFGLTLLSESLLEPSVYILVVGSIPVALGSYALISPLPALRSQLAELHS